MIKGLIFDLDGTLIDSIKDITTSANLALKDYNYPTQNEDIVRLHTGNGFRKLIKELLPIDSNDELIDEVTKVYTNYYAKHYMDETSDYEGIHELSELRRQRSSRHGKDHRQGSRFIERRCCLKVHRAGVPHESERPQRKNHGNSRRTVG